MAHRMRRVTAPAARPGILRLARAGLVLALAASAGFASEEANGGRLAGRPLIEALQILQARGLRLIYSSDVVGEEMRVVDEPSEKRPRAILARILAPHGLEAIDGPRGTLLIVRKERAAPPASPDRAAAPEMVERVVVSPGREEWGEGRPDSGEAIGGDEIRSLPGLGDDAQRALAAHPGVASGDRSAEFSVRGGEPGDVLVLFDGLELYDPFHLRSFQRFSGIIDTLTVGGAEYFTGAFPVEYGDRMSGVLDMYASVPAGPGTTSISSSFINSRLMTDGTFRGGAGHWLVSGREWHPDAVVRTMDRENEGFTPSYYDLMAKVQVPLGPRTVLAGNFLAAHDRVEFSNPEGEEAVDAASGSGYGWLTLKSLWSPRLYSRTLFSAARIQNVRDGRFTEEDTGLLATVRDGRDLDVIGLSQDWTFQPAGSLLLKWGAGVKRLDADYEYVTRWTDPAKGGAPAGSADKNISLDPSGSQIGAYVSGQFRPLRPLRLEVGLRWDRQSYTGERQVSPRVSLVHDLGASSRLRAAWGRYYQSQGIHELQVEDGVTGFHPAQLAEQWSIGFEHEFRGGLSLRSEAYSKRISSLRPRFENLLNSFELLPEFEPDRVRIAPDRAVARGIDLSLSLDRGGPLSWWAGYSLSSIEDVIDGRRVPRSWDQPHALQAGLDFRRGDRWSLMLAGTYHTGWPTTSVGATVVTEPDGTTSIEPVLGPRNDIRFPAYHRLDLRASRHFRLGRGELTVFAEITNLYNHHNVCCVDDVTFQPQPDGSIRVDREDGMWLQRVPSLGIAWRFDH